MRWRAGAVQSNLRHSENHEHILDYFDKSAIILMSVIIAAMNTAKINTVNVNIKAGFHRGAS